MSNSFPLLYIWYSYKVAIFIFENLVKNCLFFSIVAFVMYGWIDKLVRNYSWSNFIKFIKISHNENDSLREIFYSHSLHFLPFCSYFYIYIYIYIVGPKIATTFHRVTFQFYLHLGQPLPPQPEEKSILPAIISHFSVNASWTGWEISFMKYEAWNDTWRHAHGSSPVTRHRREPTTSYIPVKQSSRINDAWKRHRNRFALFRLDDKTRSAGRTTTALGR